MVDNLRILMVAPQPFFRPRGTPFSVLHRVRALVSDGHHVDMVTYPFGEDIDMPGLQIFRSTRPPLIRDVKIGPSAAKLILDVPLYLKTVERLKNENYDVIHSHEEAAFFAVRLAKKYGLPHIYDMHSSLPQQLQNFGKFDFWPIRRIFERFEAKVLGTCDGVITICEDLAAIAAEKCPETPHRMIENTADDRKVFSSSGRDVRKELGLQDNDIILYTGTFETYQGLDLLKEAFARVASERPAAHLLLVGGTPNQVRAFRAGIRSTAIEDRVTLTGTVHPSEIPAYIDAADLIASPRSSGTNTPLKIYGYLRSGKPIVATDRWTHTQTLTPQMAELVPATPEGLAGGIRHILEDGTRRGSIVQKATEFAAREYSDNAYVDKVLSLYRDTFGRLNDNNSAPIRSVT